jgi:hypothetical protein
MVGVGAAPVLHPLAGSPFPPPPLPALCRSGTVPFRMSPAVSLSSLARALPQRHGSFSHVPRGVSHCVLGPSPVPCTIGSTDKET